MTETSDQAIKLIQEREIDFLSFQEATQAYLLTLQDTIGEQKEVNGSPLTICCQWHFVHSNKANKASLMHTFEGAEAGTLDSLKQTDFMEGNHPPTSCFEVMQEEVVVTVEHVIMPLLAAA